MTSYLVSMTSSPHYQADYRGDGKVELICCSVEGEIRGYLPSSAAVQVGSVGDSGEGAGPEHWKQLELLTQRKQVSVCVCVCVHVCVCAHEFTIHVCMQSLLLELGNFEASEKVCEAL